MTLIKLEHTLFTEVAAGHLLNGFGNNIHPEDEDPFVIYNNDDIYDNQIYRPQPAAPDRSHRLYPVKSLLPPPFVSTVSTYKQKTDR